MVKLEALKGICHFPEVDSCIRDQRVDLAETEAMRRHKRSGNWRLGRLGEGGFGRVDNWEVRKENKQEQNLPEKS